MIFVYDNYQKVRTIQELVDLSEYSDSGFKKKFAKVFGTSPSQWLKEQTAIQVQFDLYNSPLSIKELADKHKFSSVAHFTTFCHNNFGKPPGQMRREISGKDTETQKCFKP